MTAKPKRAPRRADKIELRQPPAHRRATETELQLRHADVASLLLSRFTRAQVCEFVIKKWGADEPTADRYIAAAKQLIADRIAEHKAATVDDAIDALFDLIRRARGDSDLRLEHDIRKDVAKLLGLYPAEKHRFDGTIITTDVTADEMAQARDKAKVFEQQLAQDAAQSSDPRTEKPDAT